MRGDTMQNFILIISLLIIIVFSAFKLKTFIQKQRQKKLYTSDLEPPIWADSETQLLFHYFNESWSTTIEETVNRRIHNVRPELTETDIRERWHELKKFLFLAGISKKLPMFSDEVDELWHFFLEEETLYNDFCFYFIDEKIEHHPHGSPKKLPAERAWFDILYVSFFTISSHSHLWGAFLKENAEHQMWIEKILDHPDELIHLFGKETATPESMHTLTTFLQFAKKQLTADSPEFTYERIQQTDGYWYGAALFSLYLYESPEDLLQYKKDNYAHDTSGGSGFVASSEREKEWDELTGDVNTYEEGSSHTSSGNGFFSNDSSDSGSDSGSSCSSCSGCSS